jgi:hypothetical protein
LWRKVCQKPQVYSALAFWSADSTSIFS